LRESNYGVTIKRDFQEKTSRTGRNRRFLKNGPNSYAALQERNPIEKDSVEGKEDYVAGKRVPQLEAPYVLRERKKKKERGGRANNIEGSNMRGAERVVQGAHPKSEKPLAETITKKTEGSGGQNYRGRVFAHQGGADLELVVLKGNRVKGSS